MVVIASYRWVPPLISVALVGWAYWKAGAHRYRHTGARAGRAHGNGERTHQLLREAELPQLGGTLIAAWPRDDSGQPQGEPEWRLRIDLPAPDPRTSRVVREWKASETRRLYADLRRAVEHMRALGGPGPTTGSQSFGEFVDLESKSGIASLVFGLNGLGFRLQRRFSLPEAEALVLAWGRLDAKGEQMTAKLDDLDAT